MSLREFSYNDLLVDAFVFSEVSCLNNIVYGVDTGCEVCEGYFNRCLFDRLVELLMATQLQTEEYLDYALKSRYIEEEISWNGESKLLQLSYPNLETLNVRQTSTYLFNLPISPYIAENVVTTGPDCVIELETSLVENPEELIFWYETTRVKRDEGRPIEKESGTWTIPLTFKNCGENVNVAHCNLVFVDIPTDECEDGIIQPVINGKNIPVYKIEEEISPGVDRYWLYVWTLINPVFFSANLGKGEYWKLHEEIEVYCLTETVAPPEVFVEEKLICCDPIEFSSNNDAMFQIIFTDDGIVYLQPTELCVQLCNGQKKIKFKVYYKVEDPTQAQQDNLKQIISYLVAAKLPLTSCRCKVKIGFIEVAQTPYTETIFFSTGGQKIVPRYGDFYGQLRYDIDLHEMVPFRKGFKI